MVWGIIGALDREVELIRDRMTVTETATLYNSPLYKGTLHGRDVVVVCCGIGKVNAAVCTSAMIREFGVDTVVNVGIAGCTDRELHILDVVVSETVAFHDIDPDLFSRFYPGQARFDADDKLLRHCTAVLDAMEDRKFAYKTGAIATGDVFVNDSAVRADIVRRLSPACVEMEGAAIGEVAFMNGVPFLVIRTMSDSADDNADESYDNFLDLAAENSARIVMKMIETYTD